VFGAVLGVLYLVGGQTVQFSGSEGSKLLLQRSDHYATLAVVGIVFVKLLATSWSLTAGYRGGLVFPSVFAGVGVALVIADIWSGAAGPGLAIGAVAGVLTAMTSVVLGPIMLLSLLPLSLLGVGLAGAAGAVAGDKLFIRLGVLPEREPADANAAA
jgi:H+/Cl- antiporter ClcA